MASAIFWSSLAENDFDTILQYLKQNWSDSVVNQFIDIVEEIIYQISLNPQQFPIINSEKNIRKAFLTKQNTIFYYSDQTFVFILRIYDNRQDPNLLDFNDMPKFNRNND